MLKMKFLNGQRRRNDCIALQGLFQFEYPNPGLTPRAPLRRAFSALYLQLQTGDWQLHLQYAEIIDYDEVICSEDSPVASLHALANYDSMTPFGVITPFSSGCNTLTGVAMRELESDTPKAVLGLFDPSARICVKPDLLTFSAPWPRFVTRLENMDRCFLAAELWKTVCKRMQPAEN